MAEEKTPLKWKFEAGDSVSSSPTVSDGVAYFGSEDSHLYAVDTKTGEEKWKFETGDIIYSSPAILNGVVYYGAVDHLLDGYLYALDAKTGEEKWKFLLDNVELSPAVSDGVVYVGAVDYLMDQYLYAVDAKTGKEKWKFMPEYDIFSSPEVSDGMVYFGSRDNHLYAVDIQIGAEKWKFETGDHVYSPAISDGVVYFVSYDHHLYAVDAKNGKEKWKFKTEDPVSSSPAVSNGVVYFGSRDNHLYAVDAKTGEEKWKFETLGGIYSPAVSNGVVYICSSNNLYAVDIELAEKLAPAKKTAEQKQKELNLKRQKEEKQRIEKEKAEEERIRKQQEEKKTQKAKEKIKEHIFFGIRLSEGEDILCFGAEWLGTEDIYFFLENYNDYSPLWLTTEMYYVQDTIDSPPEYEDDALDYNYPLGGHAGFGTDLTKEDCEPVEIILYEKKQIFKGPCLDWVKVKDTSEEFDKTGKSFILKMNGVLLGYDFLYGNPAEEYYETFCPTEEIPHDEILIKLSPFPSEKDVAHKDFFSKTAQSEYYKNRVAVADNFCPVAIFPSLKSIKEELEKWPDIVSNEIELIEIDTDCKSMK